MDLPALWRKKQKKLVEHPLEGMLDQPWINIWQRSVRVGDLVEPDQLAAQQLEEAALALVLDVQPGDVLLTARLELRALGKQRVALLLEDDELLAIGVELALEALDILAKLRGHLLPAFVHIDAARFRHPLTLELLLLVLEQSGDANKILLELLDLSGELVALRANILGVQQERLLALLRPGAAVVNPKND